MPNNFSQHLRQCVEILLPHYCILCGSSSQTYLDLCVGCLNDLPRIKTACAYCGIPLIHANSICGTCLKKRPLYNSLFAPFHYQHPINYIISAIKFRHKLSFTQLLGNLVAKELQQHIKLLPDVIIPIPLHPERLRDRGYNQALEIAKPISHLLQIPIDYSVCIRTKMTQQQTGLVLAERIKNIRNAFHVAHDFMAKKVAIVDDVVTTGSTVTELCKVLRAYGVEHIQVWSCARTSLK